MERRGFTTRSVICRKTMRESFGESGTAYGDTRGFYARKIPI